MRRRRSRRLAGQVRPAKSAKVHVTANVTKSRIKHREHRAPSPVGWAPNKEKSLRAQPSYRGAEARELGEAPNGTLRCTVVIRGNAERLQGWVRPCAVRRDTACNR